MCSATRRLIGIVFFEGKTNRPLFDSKQKQNQVLELVEEDLSKIPGACMTISIECKVEVHCPNDWFAAFDT